MTEANPGEDPAGAPADDPLSVRIETGAALLGLAGLGLFLARRYVLHPDSDPVRWFAFARDFAAQWDEAHLAYGFPLVASFAVTLVSASVFVATVVAATSPIVAAVAVA